MSTRPLTAAEQQAAISATAFEQAANRQAAAIAAREVRAYILRTGSEAHRQSLAAYEAGTRSWPWPAPSDADLAAADAAVCKLFDALGIEPARVLTRRGS